jgi:hypothetical protein
MSSTLDRGLDAEEFVEIADDGFERRASTSRARRARARRGGRVVDVRV